MSTILSKKQFSQLLSDIKKLKHKSETQNNQQIIKTYWQIGKRIEKEKLSQNANYHNSIIKNLSENLSVDRSTISRCITFFYFYQTPPANQILTWSHYRKLITIKDKKLRDLLEKQAIKEFWSKNQLISAIKQATHKKPANQKTILKRPTDPTYLYRATVLEVIDGDTVNLQIDLGFYTNKEQRIRLACLDCHEINTTKGKTAKQFTTEKLANTKTIIIQTRKADIYGRYIAHIFYDPTNKLSMREIFTKGIYLNEELLQNKMAIEI
jgi:micrococcal nuclease